MFHGYGQSKNMWYTHRTSQPILPVFTFFTIIFGLVIVLLLVFIRQTYGGSIGIHFIVCTCRAYGGSSWVIARHLYHILSYLHSIYRICLAQPVIFYFLPLFIASQYIFALFNAFTWIDLSRPMIPTEYPMLWYSYYTFVSFFMMYILSTSHHR